MGAIVTTQTRIYNADNFIEATQERSQDVAYVFIGKETAWDDENFPDAIDFSTEQEISFFRNLIVAKRIENSNVVSMARRFDWQSGETYRPYDDNFDMVDYILDSVTLISPVYVRTDEGNVYKCIDAPLDWTTSPATQEPSTIKPTGTSLSTFQTADGYIWKYMYTLSPVQTIEFETEQFMPCKTVGSTGGSQFLVQQAAIDGGIHRIVILTAGNLYGAGTTTITITDPEGNGTGATATPVIDGGGRVIGATITSPGSGYRSATVTISDSANLTNTTATARAVISPIGGHGSDPRKELVATFVLVKCKLNGAEGYGANEILLDSNNDPLKFRQVGVVVNPLNVNTGTQLTITAPNIDLEPEDLVKNSNVTPSYGRVVSWDYVNNKVIVKVEQLYPFSFAVGQTLYRNDGPGLDVAVGTISAISTFVNLPATESLRLKSDLIFGTGKIIYIENRTPIQRSANQTEDVKLILEF